MEFPYEWSPEAAWALGVVYGDGYVDPRKGRRRVVVVSQDRDLLEKWVAWLGKGELRKRPSSKAYSVEVGCKKLTDWFESQGISGKKSGTMQWPEGIPEQYTADFVRGLWDTDGSVLRGKGIDGRTDFLRMSIALRSEGFVQSLISCVPHPLIYERAVRKSGPYVGYVMHVARLHGLAAEDLFRWIYQNAPESACMDRKKQAGLEFLQWASDNASKCERCGAEVRARKFCGGCSRTKYDSAVCACGSVPVVAHDKCRRCYNAQRKSDSSGPYILNRFDRLSAAIGSASGEAERRVFVDNLVQEYLVRGFPKRTFSPEEGVLSGVTSGAVRVDGAVISNVSRTGRRTCSSFYVHMYSARYRGSKHSVAAAFKDEEALRRMCELQIKHGDPVTPRRMIRAAAALFRGPSNFPPVLARKLVDMYGTEGGVVLDPCAGYGGRLLGTLASEKSMSYIGFDAEGRSVKSAIKMAEYLGESDRVRMEPRIVQDRENWPEAQLLLTGPPYFRTEVYGSTSDKANASMRTYAQWLEGFVRPMAEKAFKAVPVAVINVKEVKVRDRLYPIPTDFIRLFEEQGFQLTERFVWKQPSFGKRVREDEILVFSNRSAVAAI